MFDAVTSRRGATSATARAPFAVGAVVVQLVVFSAAASRGAPLGTGVDAVAVTFLRAPPPSAPAAVPTVVARPTTAAAAARTGPRVRRRIEPAPPVPAPVFEPSPPADEGRGLAAAEVPAGVGAGSIAGPRTADATDPGAGSRGPDIAEGAPDVGGDDRVPLEAAAGFRKPRTAEPGCVERSIHVSDALLDGLGVVTVRFAVDPDGTPSRFQPVSGGVAERVAPDLWRAVRSCRWIPGADASGRPRAIWVILPVRFTIE